MLYIPLYVMLMGELSLVTLFPISGRAVFCVSDLETVIPFEIGDGSIFTVGGVRSFGGVFRAPSLRSLVTMTAVGLPESFLSIA